jgi:hypothetical protein
MTKEMLGLDRDYTRKKMKERFRMAWKDPGYRNEAFDSVHPLRPKVLTEWEHLRCIMPERSYKYYPDKGHLKISHRIEEFKYPSRKGLSEKYADFLENHEKKFMDFALRPSKYGGQIKAQQLLAKIELDSQKDPFKLPSTAPGQEFGYPTLRSLSKTQTNSTKLPQVRSSKRTSHLGLHSTSNLN